MEKYAILAIDIGTTNLKVTLYDKKLNVINSNTKKVYLIYYFTF
jgi:sugar (pentulose or hexulose) kinase